MTVTESPPSERLRHNFGDGQAADPMNPYLYLLIVLGPAAVAFAIIYWAIRKDMRTWPG
jgi:hypothetical protein